MEIPDPIRRSLEESGGLGRILSSLPEDDEITDLSKTFQALSDPLRVRILLILRKQSLCVCLLKALTSVPDSKLSYHLSILKDHDLISGEQEGNWIIYRLSERAERILEKHCGPRER